MKKKIKKRFKKEFTADVILEKEMKAGKLIYFITSVHTERDILTRVPRGKNVYKVTFEDERQANLFTKEGEMTYNRNYMKANFVYADSVIVSFMHCQHISKTTHLFLS